MKAKKKRTIEPFDPDEPPGCKHFNGRAHRQCALGIAYDSVEVPHDPPVHGRTASIPCLDRDDAAGVSCEHFVVKTDEEREAELDEIERVLDLHDKGLSVCCEAPLDESKVIRGGQYDGHGPRTCSKCGEIAFIV